MATISAARSSSLRRAPMHGNRRQILIRPITLSMKDTKKLKPITSDELKLEVTQVPKLKGGTDTQLDLRFDRLTSDEELNSGHRREFGRYVAREALIDEEYWTVAWLRAESHWEDKPNMRHLESYKRQFAEREFMSLKRRCNNQLAEKWTCIIAMKKKEMNVNHTVLSSIVGTLDLSIRQEPVNPPIFSSVYRTDQPKIAYVANLCVAKYARRHRIASNMLQLAVEAAKSYGVYEVFVHVRKDNTGARKLYDNLGFQMVGVAPSQSLEEQTYLLCFKA